jgi:cytochrome P450
MPSASRSKTFAPNTIEFYLNSPETHFKRLRASDPVHWFDDGPFWCVTRHATVSEISKQPLLFSSAYGTQLFEIPLRLAGEPSFDDGAPSIIRMDPPEHNRHRRIVMGAFTPRHIADLEQYIRDICRESLDAVDVRATSKKTPCDFVDSIAIPLPMKMIADLLGVPKKDLADFRRWSEVIIKTGSGGITDDTATVLAEFYTYLTEKASERREKPRDDLLSRLILAEVDGESLSDPEIVIFCLTLLVAGNETTRNLISGGMRALIEHPDQWDLLRQNPTLIPGAVEEMLRYVSPIRNFARRVMSDTEIDGKQLKEGQYLLLLYGSANRDEKVFGDDAESFDIRRTSAKRHIAFGFGEHLCLGASLARLETRVMFEELLARYSRIELAGPVEELPSMLVNGIERMPVICRS